MILSRAMFKNRFLVWVVTNRDGQPLDEKGMVRMRYKPDGQEYTANLANLKIVNPAQLLEVDDTESPVRKPEARKGSALPVKAAKAGGDQASPVEMGPDGGDSAHARGLGIERGGKTIVIHTDGACSGNPGPCSAAALLVFGNKERTISRYLGVGTNNVGELTAVKIALESLKRRDIPVEVHTDSSYVIGVLTKGWKAKANGTLIAELRELLAGFDTVRFVKVRGHAGIPENELVDQLARDAISTRSGVSETRVRKKQPSQSGD